MVLGMNRPVLWQKAAQMGKGNQGSQGSGYSVFLTCRKVVEDIQLLSQVLP